MDVKQYSRKRARSSITVRVHELCEGGGRPGLPSLIVPTVSGHKNNTEVQEEAAALQSELICVKEEVDALSSRPKQSLLSLWT